MRPSQAVADFGFGLTHKVVQEALTRIAFNACLGIQQAHG